MAVNDTREIMPGVTLTRSTLGGYSVEVKGIYVGWIHASIGEEWNAYLRDSGHLGTPLGRFSQLDAVKAIVAAAERRGPYRNDNPNASMPRNF